MGMLSNHVPGITSHRSDAPLRLPATFYAEIAYSHRIPTKDSVWLALIRAATQTLFDGEAYVRIYPLEFLHIQSQSVCFFIEAILKF